MRREADLPRVPAFLGNAGNALQVLLAKAYDAAGNVGQHQIAATVANAAPPPPPPAAVALAGKFVPAR